jgi:hypothetical protein
MVRVRPTETGQPIPREPTREPKALPMQLARQAPILLVPGTATRQQTVLVTAQSGWRTSRANRRQLASLPQLMEAASQTSIRVQLPVRTQP